MEVKITGYTFKWYRLLKNGFLKRLH